jgi:SAM-dependent methyltransferase
MSWKRSYGRYDADLEARTYGVAFYDEHAKYHPPAAVVAVFDWVNRTFPAATSIVDVGCGRGEFLKAFEDAGWRVLGIDMSVGAKQSHLIKDENFVSADATVPFTSDIHPRLTERFDITLSLETYEHVVPHLEDRLLSNLASFGSSVLIVSCGSPKGGGLHHYNPLPPETWIPRVEHLGFVERPEMHRDPDAPCALNSHRNADRKACRLHWRCLPLAHFYVRDTRIFTPCPTPVKV